MAQILTNGFVAGVTTEEVGEKKVKKVTVSFVDDTQRKNVFFPVSFWGKLADQAEKFKKGQRFYLLISVEDGSYLKTDENKKPVLDANGQQVKVMAYNFVCLDYVEDPCAVRDLFSEFAELKAEAEAEATPDVDPTIAAGSVLTPVDIPLPDFRG